MSFKLRLGGWVGAFSIDQCADVGKGEEERWWEGGHSRSMRKEDKKLPMSSPIKYTVTVE